jgi:16S rRNA (uracil1498-N3)-methyltransferase
MRSPKHYRLSTPEPLAQGRQLLLSGNAQHYLVNVLRLEVGEGVTLFNRADGVFEARIADISKRSITLTIGAQTRPAEVGTGLTVCFAPIKGGRLETIIEKATELGADMLQPVLTSRTVVDKVNIERAELIAREAAEQCERASWPTIHEPVKLLTLLGNWPADLPLIYGDESGGGTPIAEALKAQKPSKWAILAGPEGGFTPDEFAALARVKAAIPVSLGPRILRADTAIITLCAATLMAWGDWHHAPRFEG